MIGRPPRSRDIAAGFADPADSGGLHPCPACSAAGGDASPTRPAVDRRLCGTALAPPVHEFHINRADAFFALGLASDSARASAGAERARNSAI